MSSRAPAATTTTTMLRAGVGAGTDHLWAKAAELERDFAGYKRQLAERRSHAAVAEAASRAGGGDRDDNEEERAGDAAAGGRGRRYEEYVRRRDERLRQEWHSRMERKEAEVQALWARLDRTGSRARRGGGETDGGELAADSHAREDQVKPQQKPGNLAVKVKPSIPVTPRGSNPGHPAANAKLARPRTGVPSSSSLAAASPRLSTPDPRRRPPHLHREHPQAAEPPATPRKENRLLPSTAFAAASPATTPRPRTSMLSRSRSMYKDRGCSSVAVRESPTPRPPRFQPPRSSYDSATAINLKETTTPSPRGATAVMHRSSCSREQAVVVADRKKASAVAPEPFLVWRSGNGVEPTSPAPAAPKGLPYSTEIAPAGGGNADNKRNQEHVDQSSDKFGSVEITGDSDTEPSYVYIKKDSDEQIAGPQASADLGTCPRPEPRSDNEDSDTVEDTENVEDAMESTGSNEVAGGEDTDNVEEGIRRESSESLYSNVQSSFSPRSELDTSATDSPLPSATERSPESNTSPWTRKSTETEDAERRLPIPTTPRSSVAVSYSVQSPLDAMNGLKRLLTFGRRNGKTSDAAAVFERTPRSMAPAPPAGDGGSVSGECPAGGSAKLRLDDSDVNASDDLDNSYVISPHVRSLQSFGPSYPACSELKEPVLHAKSPRVHRSFFSFSSFKSRAN